LGYFANGTEGEIYTSKYCDNCLLQEEDGGCPIMDAHLIYNYDQNKIEEVKGLLSCLIPTEGTDNLQCRMYREKL